MSKIEWTQETWNPVVGCTRASAGCDNCYAVTMTKRLAAMGQEKYAGLVNPGKGHFNGVVRTVQEALEVPLRWRKPRTIFVNSMSDLFHDGVPTEFIWKVWSVMRQTPQHTYQILTKRPERMQSVVAEMYEANPHLGVPSNLWLGTSVENQDAAWRVDELRKAPAAVRFLSCEPLIGPLESLNLDGIHWVIVGGESERGARACDVAWVRSLVKQCKAAGVPAFVKQLGSRPAGGWDADGMPTPDEWACYGIKLADSKGGNPDEWPEDLRIRELPTPQPYGR